MLTAQGREQEEGDRGLRVFLSPTHSSRLLQSGTLANDGDFQQGRGVIRDEGRGR